MKKTFVNILFCFVATAALFAASPRNAQSVKRDKQQTQKEIAETQKKIKENESQTRRKLDELNDLSGRIEMQKTELVRISAHLDSLNGAITQTSDSIASMEAVTKVLRDDLKKTLRSLRSRRQAVSNIAFVFSSESFGKAVKRINYINELNRWRVRKMKKLSEQIASVREQQTKLESLRSDHARTLSDLDVARKVLETRQSEEKQMVAQLRKEGKNLNKVLAQKRQRARELDRELDRIIAEEQRLAEQRRKAAEKAAREKAAREKAAREKAEKNKDKSKPQSPTQPEKPDKAEEEAQAYAEAERKLNGSFEANKGNLLFPVAGKYQIVGTFGRGGVKDIANMQFDNSGIDISVPSGTVARAVFSGTVSSVFYMPGYQNIVIVRHGSYLTVYAGLTNLTVKKGSAVKSGTALGTIYTDAANDRQTILHFEVRHEREKLNPLKWVR